MLNVVIACDECAYFGYMHVWLLSFLTIMIVHLMIRLGITPMHTND